MCSRQCSPTVSPINQPLSASQSLFKHSDPKEPMHCSEHQPFVMSPLTPLSASCWRRALTPAWFLSPSKRGFQLQPGTFRDFFFFLFDCLCDDESCESRPLQSQMRNKGSLKAFSHNFEPPEFATLKQPLP